MTSERGRPSVLLVDDDPDIRAIVADVLASEGYDVLTAENGAVALELLRRRGPTCLILLDLMMPVMDGWQFLAEKAKDPALPPIPVVVVSAIRRPAPESPDIAGYLDKPLDLEPLLEVVARHC